MNKKLFIIILLVVFSCSCVLGGGFLLFGQNLSNDSGQSETDDNLDSDAISGYWTDSGNYATAFAGGSGTSSSPYQIATAAQLAYFAYTVNNVGTTYAGEYVQLTADIDLAGHYWVPIGYYYENDFEGTFDGNQKIVSNMTILSTESYDEYFGFFGFVYNGATIKKLVLDNVDISYSSGCTLYGVGGVVGYACYGATISECIVTGSIKGTYAVGGIVGVVNYGETTISDCSSNASVYAGNTSGIASVGGIVGCDDATGNLNILKCANYGTVDSESYGNGGIIGTAKDGTLIERCLNQGAISGGSESGGIVGNAYTSSSSYILIYHCYNTGSITTGSYGAGIVGYADYVSIQSSWSYCSISLTTYQSNGTGIIDKVQSGYSFSKNYWYDKAGNVDTSHTLGGSYLSTLDSDTNCGSSGLDTTFFDNLSWSVSTSDCSKVWLVGHGQKPYLSSSIWWLDTGTTGSSSSPFKISTVNDLRVLSIRTNMGSNSYVNFKQTANIDISSVSPWTMIGTRTNDKTFCSTYDGGGYTISGLTIKSSTTDYQGLFGFTWRATIKNLKIDTVNFYGSGAYHGALIGYAYYTTINNVQVTNAYVASSASSAYVGGVVGWAIDTTITDVSFSGSVGYTGKFAGGIIGYLTGTESYIKNATTEGKVEDTGGSGSHVGGIVGYMTTNDVTVSNYYISDSTNNAAVNGYTYVGGIAGLMYYDKIVHCTNNGTVTGTGSTYVGGLVGWYYGPAVSGDIEAISYSCNNGNVSGSSRYVGGIAGLFQGGKANSSYYYAWMVACVNKGTISGYSYVGGLVGRAYYTSKIHASYNAGDVTSTSSYVGGIVGYSYGYTSSGYPNFIRVCYNKGAVSGSNYVGGIVGNTVRYLCMQSCYNVGSVSGSGTYVGDIAGYVKYATSTYGISNVYTPEYGSIGTVYSGASYVSITRLADLNSRTYAQNQYWSFYDDWNFTSLWKIAVGYNDGLPFFWFEQVQVSFDCNDGRNVNLFNEIYLDPECESSISYSDGTFTTATASSLSSGNCYNFFKFQTYDTSGNFISELITVYTGSTGKYTATITKSSSLGYVRFGANGNLADGCTNYYCNGLADGTYIFSFEVTENTSSKIVFKNVKLEAGSTTTYYSPPCQNVAYNEAYGTLPTTSRTNFTFANWYTGTDYSTQVYTSTLVQQNNHTLYARWKFYIRYYRNGGTAKSANWGLFIGTSKSYTYYEDIGTTIKTNDLTRAGFEPNGWNKTASLSSSPVYAGGESYSGGNLVLYANYSPIAINVTFVYKFADCDSDEYFEASMSDFNVKVSYYSIFLSGNTTSYVTRTLSGGKILPLRAYQTLTFSDFDIPSDYVFIDAVIGDEQPTASDSPVFEDTVYVGKSNVTIYLCFKKIGAGLQYDSEDKYFYFEDGVFPQTAVVTLENGVALETKLNSSSATTSTIDNLGTVKYVTLNGFKYMGVQVVADDGDASKTATKTVKLRDNNATSVTYLEYKDYTFSEGVYYWFRFDPIRWRVSDYGVSEDEIPTDWASYAQGQTNVEVVSDVLWWGALNDKTNALSVGNTALETSLGSKLSSNSLVDSDYELKYVEEDTRYIELPSSYQQVEYIESTGGEYIDTGYLPTANTNIEMDFAYEGANQTTGWIPICGIRGEDTSTYFNWFVAAYDLSLSPNYAGYDPGASELIMLTKGQRYVLSNDAGTTYLDGVQTHSTTNVLTSQTTSTFYIFSMNVKGAVDSRRAYMKLYGFKIYEEDVLVRDYVPCVRTSDNVAGLYDLVEGAFYQNKGTGIFSVGSEIKEFVSAEINVDSWANSSTNSKISTSEVAYDGNAFRVANVEEISGYQSDLRSYASQLVCAITGKDQNQYFEYWTRDFGQQIGCGTYVTKSGVVNTNTYYTRQKGVRFAYNMMESSNTGDFTDGTVDYTSTASAVKRVDTSRYNIRICPPSASAYGGDVFEYGGIISVTITVSDWSDFYLFSVNDVVLSYYEMDGNTMTFTYKINSTRQIGTYSHIDIGFSLSTTTEEEWEALTFSLDKFTYTPPY